MCSGQAENVCLLSGFPVGSASYEVRLKRIPDPGHVGGGFKRIVPP